jgi:hypothetical protein
MQLALEAAPFRRMCNVHLRHGGGVAPMAMYASSTKVERVAYSCQLTKLSEGAELQIAVGGGLLRKLAQ